MVNRYLVPMLVVAGILIVVAGPALAQSSAFTGTTHNQIIRLGPGELVPNGPFNLRYTTPRMLPENTRRAAIASARDLTAVKVATVRLWQGSVGFNGPVQQPFVMVGNSPAAGGATVIPTQLLPIMVTFEGTLNTATDAPITLGLDLQTLSEVLLGPDFAKAPYGTGITQFADAVQRAEFFPVERPTWHTLIKPPKILTPVVIDVPDNIGGVPPYQMFQASDGTYFALLDYNFFVSQLETIFQFERTNVHGLLIPMVKDIGLFENGDPGTCCVGGFHDAYVASGQKTTVRIQTFAYTTWTDASVAQALGHPSFTDIVALSHEIQEWMNDPLDSNLVNPSWQFPDSVNCQGNLEVGDPIETLPDGLATYPVTVNGFTYHPQNMALFQWFAQVTPSNAVDGAYSYPNESALTSPSVSCPP
jgi:hypothetical protein